MKIFLTFLLLSALTPAVWAETICRQQETADFGSAVATIPGNGFVISQGCDEQKLVAQKPISLSVLLGQGGRHTDMDSQKSEIFRSWAVQFDFASASLDHSDKQVLDLIPKGTKVRVVGYTCTIGNESYNRALSAQRALAVSAYLRKKGVLITTSKGLGECCPVSISDLTKNRRAIIEEEK